MLVPLAAVIAGAGLWLMQEPELTLSHSRFPERFPVHGIDVSRHNGVIDWPRVADGGVHFAWIKATEGGDVVDPRFRENLEGAQRAGLKAGAYHFFTFCRSAPDQARNFLSAVETSVTTLPPVVDVEFIGNCRSPPAPEEIRRSLENWLQIVETALGRRAVIYTMPDVDALVLQGLDRPRWIRSTAAEPAAPWIVWQFDPSGKVPGIDGPVDLNVFNGPLDQFAP